MDVVWQLEGWRWDGGELACPLCSSWVRRRDGPASDVELGLRPVTDDELAEFAGRHVCHRCGFPASAARWTPAA